MYQLQNIISQINTHHENATLHANSAIESARAAGELLLHVKSVLPHGEFTLWVEQNLNIGLRQVQRYLREARQQLYPKPKLLAKSDMMSHLTNSKGIWKKGKWQPEPGYQYLFNEDGAVYWVLPSTDSSKWFHVSKHYSGDRMSTSGFRREWTIFSKITDPDLTNEFYVGTTRPLGYTGVESVIKSYGLQNFEKSLVLGKQTQKGFESPFGQPGSENWYWGENGEWDDREAYIDSLLKADGV